jgi:ribonuclease Z
MSTRELVVLGTASQVPTRDRNHNGYLLLWDGEGLLFDPGEGTQRQMSRAGVAASDVTRLCITHFHGDHCLGVPGVVQRLSLDQVAHTVVAHYPASGSEFFDRLRHASVFYDAASIVPAPVATDGVVATGGFGTLSAMRLDHSVEAYGYRLVEPDGRRMLPDRLAAHGISGPDVARLMRDGQIRVSRDGGPSSAGDGRVVTVEEVSAVRRGQRFAFVMDTRLCENVYALAEGADLLVIESTYLDGQADLAAANGHLTAGQAARVAAEGGVRRLVLTHFSQRFDDPTVFATEAAKHFGGEVIVAEDLDRVPVPARR